MLPVCFYILICWMSKILYVYLYVLDNLGRRISTVFWHMLRMVFVEMDSCMAVGSDIQYRAVGSDILIDIYLGLLLFTWLCNQRLILYISKRVSKGQMYG